jgi:ATP-dependent Clp protease ATP-binding subunit ClpX
MSDQSQYENCSFCNKHKDEVKKLIVGNEVAICNECVDLCRSLLDDDVKERPKDITDIDPQNLNPILINM